MRVRQTVFNSQNASPNTVPKITAINPNDNEYITTLYKVSWAARLAAVLRHPAGTAHVVSLLAGCNNHFGRLLVGREKGV
jgi:hypothetical protein